MLLTLAQNAAYATNVPEEWIAGINRSREVAYNLMSKLLAQELGANNQDQIDRLVRLALGHMDQWFVTRTAAYVQPFMVALTSEALIMYHHKTGDTRVVPAIRRAADYLWAHRAALGVAVCPDGRGEIPAARGSDFRGGRRAGGIGPGQAVQPELQLERRLCGVAARPPVPHAAEHGRDADASATASGPGATRSAGPSTSGATDCDAACAW